MSLKRIHLHWTGGGYKPTADDLAHYHYIIDGDAREHAGKLPPEANIHTKGAYMAHTLGANTGAIGIAVACMAGAIERPFKWGVAPMKQIQLDALCALSARLALRYNIPCHQTTILTHAEVQQTLGVAQRGKWDITVLPGNLIPGDAIEIGDIIRAKIRTIMEGCR